MNVQLHFRAPQGVILAVHGDGELAYLPLPHAVGLGCDGADFVELQGEETVQQRENSSLLSERDDQKCSYSRHTSDFQTVLQLDFVVQRCGDRSAGKHRRRG